MSMITTQNGDMLGIFCPECRKTDQRSKLYIGNSKIVEKFTREKYYDEYGNYHDHDVNVRQGKWECSNGHGGLYNKTYMCQVSNCSYSGY